MHRGHKEIAGSTDTVTGEYPACSIRAVSSGRKPEYQHSRVRITEPGHGSGPIRIAAKRSAFHTRDIGAVRTKPLALVATNDVVMNLAE